PFRKGRSDAAFFVGGDAGRPRRLYAGSGLRYHARPAMRARSSAVEHYLDMVGVTGSIPVAPTTRQWQSGRLPAARSNRPRPPGSANLTATTDTGHVVRKNTITMTRTSILHD